MTMRIKEEAVPEQAAARAGVEATRERMLRCALELFTERGYDGSSIGMIASGMELSKGAVSYHFPTKEDLLEAVVEPAWSDLDAFLEKVGPGPLRPGRRREAIAEYVSLMVKHRALLAFLAREGDRQRPESGLSRWPSLADRLEQLFYGDAPDLGERIYGAAAFRGLALASSMFPEVGDDVLQEHLLRFAETTLARPRRRPRDNRAEPSQ
jgi:AcrR family transcriptional regulator